MLLFKRDISSERGWRNHEFAVFLQSNYLIMRKPLILLLTILVMASCSDPNTRYVKKAVRIMDKHGIYAQGPEWETAKQEALEWLTKLD